MTCWLLIFMPFPQADPSRQLRLASEGFEAGPSSGVLAEVRGGPGNEIEV